MPVWARMSEVNRRSLPSHSPRLRSIPGSFWGPTTIKAMAATTAISEKEIPNTPGS